MEGQAHGSHEIELVIDAPSRVTRTQEHRSHSLIVAQRSASSILSRLHTGYFRISLSLGWQAVLWKSLSQPTKDSGALCHVLHDIPPTVAIAVWFLAMLVLLLVSLLYLLKCLFRFPTVKAEFLHHVGVNYFFAPSISWLLLLQSAHFLTPNGVSYLALWWVFSVPVLVLDVKIYGQWFTNGKKFLTAVANPTSQISVIGNLVAARAAALMGRQEIALCLFSLGIVHYFVLFVTLYQRLAGSDRLPAILRPVFFLFFAAPGVASLAWESISGTFDTASKILFFLSLFLFASLVCRPTLFKKSMRRFNVAWWAYSFPVTILAMASAHYAKEVNGGTAHLLRIILSLLSVIVIAALFVFTALNSKLLLPDHHSSLWSTTTALADPD